MGLTLQQKRDRETREKAERNIGNLVLYMTAAWASFAGHEFLGWKEIEAGENWGAEMGGKSFAAVHVFDTSSLDFKHGADDHFHWGDDPRDTAVYAHANPWVLMFYGSDNSSLFTRHPDYESAIDAFNTQVTPVSFSHPELMFYNS